MMQNLKNAVLQEIVLMVVDISYSLTKTYVLCICYRMVRVELPCLLITY